MYNSLVTRRHLLLGALVMASGMGLLPLGVSGSSGFSRKRTLDELHFDDFERLLGEQFVLYDQTMKQTMKGHTVHLDLVKNLLHSAPNGSVYQEWFSLAFCAPAQHSLEQGTYRFAHSTLGTFDLFIVPAQSVDYERRYIAIINRLAL